MLNFIFGLKNHIVIIFQNERRIQMKFKEIEVGKSEQIRALLTGIEERGSKAGTRYLILNFTDGEQTVTANYWNCTREEFTAKEGQVLDLRVDAKLYKGSTSYTVQSYLLTDESPEAYVTSAPMDPVDMFNKIHSFATGLGVYGISGCVNQLNKADSSQGPDRGVTMFLLSIRNSGGQGWILSSMSEFYTSSRSQRSMLQSGSSWQSSTLLATEVSEVLKVINERYRLYVRFWLRILIRNSMVSRIARGVDF